jgi:hypothetical protein
LVQRVPKALAQARRDLAHRSIKFVLLNSYCFAKGNGLRNMPELKVCA